MNLGKEFHNYATKHKNINTLTVESIVKNTISNMTPYIIEERHMNITQMDVFSRLMSDRIIWMGVGVDDQMANIIQAQLLFLSSIDDKRDITIYVNSGGGSVMAGFGILDTMQLIEPDVATVCTSMAASMAAVLLSSGTKGKRSALKHSRVMIHQVSGGSQGVASDMEINLREMLKMKKELYLTLSENTGKSYEEVEKACDRDYWMTAAEAVEFGMIDEVLVKK